jgi:hypothetical protein
MNWYYQLNVNTKRISLAVKHQVAVKSILNAQNALSCRFSIPLLATRRGLACLRAQEFTLWPRRHSLRLEPSLFIYS